MARSLKEADPPLWLRKGKGHRFKRPHPFHRTCLCLALAGDSADGQRRPVSAPDSVLRWRRLRLNGIYRVERLHEPADGEFLPATERSIPMRLADLADGDPAKALLDGVSDLGQGMDAHGLCFLFLPRDELLRNKDDRPTRKPITELPRALSAISADGDAPGYRQIYTEIVDGRLPEIWRDRTRWFFWESDLPAIAARLGLPLKSRALPNRSSAKTFEDAARI